MGGYRLARGKLVVGFGVAWGWLARMQKGRMMNDEAEADLAAIFTGCSGGVLEAVWYWSGGAPMWVLQPSAAQTLLQEFLYSALFLLPSSHTPCEPRIAVRYCSSPKRLPRLRCMLLGTPWCLIASVAMCVGGIRPTFHQTRAASIY